MTDMVRCISPVDGSVYAERPVADANDIETALSRGKAAQIAWARVPIAERAATCSKAVDAMLAMSAEIAPEMSWQMGRPVRYGAGEMGGFEERAQHMISIAEEALAPIIPEPKDGLKRMIKRVPIGVVFVIAPWNYPYLTAVNSVVPALMAGNAVVLKAAAQTLLVAERFQQAFDAAGLPEGLLQHMFLSHDQTAGIIKSGQIDQVNFTGSVAGGRAMEQAATGSFVGMGLELGGKDPAYVRADADISYAVENLVDGAFFNSGQSCCGIERIYVDAKVHDAFVEGFAELTRGYVLGNPLDEETTLGPLVKASAAEFVRGQANDAIRDGATALIDTSQFSADKAGTPYLAPQVLTNVNHQMSVMTEESFGPIVGIMKVTSDEEAIGLMNDSDYGLTASVWTSDLEAAEHIGDQIETGTVFMNRADYLDPALAWTGVKDTGKGATLSRVGFETLTRPKSYHLRHKI